MFKKIHIFSLFIIVFFPSLLKSQTPLTTAPNFSVIDARGVNQDLYSYLDNNKYVLLDFFYNECLVCQTHVPEVDNAYLKMGCNANDVFFLGINFNNTDGEVISFENKFGLNYPNVSGIDGGGNDIVSLFQIIAFPTLILIAPDKSIPKQDIWPLTSANIVDELLSVGIDSSSCPFASIKDMKTLVSFQVFPNPSKDFIYLSNNANESNLTINLLDIMGQKVLCKNTSRFSKERIDVSTLKSGIYFLQVLKNNLILFTEKVILL